MFVLLAGTWPLRSQDRPAPAPVPPPARNGATDTMESARDGIRALKVEREAPNLSGVSRPRIAAPEWHGGAASTPAVRPAPPNPKGEARNPNWLIDALAQPDAADGLAQDRDDARSGRPGARVAPDRAGLARSRAGLAPAESRSAAERIPPSPGMPGTGPITNPLTAYLDGWMTPQDFALLKPGLDGGSSALLPMADAGTAPGGFPAGALSPAGAFRGPGPAPLAPAGDRPGAGRENPFLAALNAPVAGGAVAAQTPRLALPAPGPATMASPSGQSPPSPPPASRTPDFARPAADEKYFKPLKRF